MLYGLAHRAYRYNTHLAVSSNAILCNRPRDVCLIHESMQTYATLRDFMQIYTDVQVAWLRVLVPTEDHGG